MEWTDQELDETIAHWQPRYPNEKLTREDAREINQNLLNFAKCILDIDRDMRAPAHERLDFLPLSLPRSPSPG